MGISVPEAFPAKFRGPRPVPELTAGEGELAYQVFFDLSHSPSAVRCVLKRHPEGGYVLLTCNIDATVLDGKFHYPTW